MAHLGTTDSRAVEQMIQSGDAHAKLVYDAMILNIAKNIAKCAPNVCGKVDAILLTGGIAYSSMSPARLRTGLLPGPRGGLPRRGRDALPGPGRPAGAPRAGNGQNFS